MNAILVIAGWVTAGLLTTAVTSVAARYIEQRGLSLFEIFISFLFWPYFVLALIVRLNMS